MVSSLHFLHGDARILNLIRNGDEEALVVLYKANRRVVGAYVENNRGTHDDAEDMLQEALIILWERIRAGTFRYDAKLSTFIIGVVKNLWRRRLARQRKESPSEMAYDRAVDPDPSPLEELIETEQARHVRNALEQLGDPCKKLLLLFYWDGRSLDEIAAEMGFANADTAKSKKYQCKKALQKLLVQA